MRVNLKHERNMVNAYKYAFTCFFTQRTFLQLSHAWTDNYLVEVLLKLGCLPHAVATIQTMNGYCIPPPLNIVFLHSSTYEYLLGVASG